MSLRLLIVLGGIGLTVAAVIPTCACTTPEHATRSRLKSELRNLATEEEVYFADHSTYTRDSDAMSLSPSRDVEIRLLTVTDSTYHATARDTVMDITCSILIGFGGETDGRVVC